MANTDYIGFYGDSLRRLQALDQGSMPAAPPSGPLPTAGAFGPQITGRPAFAAPGQPSMLGAQPQAQGALQPPGLPNTHQELWDQMPQEHKQDIMNQVEAAGHSIPDLYQKAVTAGDITPPEKPPTKDEMLGYLSEVALRTASNMAQHRSNNSFADFADAKLATDERRRALAQQTQDKVTALNEERRKEGVQQGLQNQLISNENARTNLLLGRQDVEEQRRRADEAAKLKTEGEYKKEDIALRQKEISARQKEAKRPVQSLNENGELVHIDPETNQATRVMETYTDQDTGEAKQRPVKPPQKDADALHEQNFVNDVGARTEQILKSIPDIAKIQAQQKGIDLRTQAREQARQEVLDDYQNIRQLRGKGGAAQTAPSDLPPGIPSGSVKTNNTKGGLPVYKTPDGRFVVSK